MRLRTAAVKSLGPPAPHPSVDLFRLQMDVDLFLSSNLIFLYFFDSFYLFAFILSFLKKSYFVSLDDGMWHCMSMNII